jgi:hypothetical protein
MPKAIQDISYINQKTDSSLTPEKEQLVRTLVFLMSRLGITRWVTDYDATLSRFHTAKTGKLQYDAQGNILDEVDDIFTEFGMFKLLVNELRDSAEIPTSLLTFSGHTAIDKTLIKAGIRDGFFDKIRAGTGRRDIDKILKENAPISDDEIAKRGSYPELGIEEKKRFAINQDSLNEPILFTADADGETAEWLQKRGVEGDVTFGQYGYELAHVYSSAARETAQAADIGLTFEKLNKLAHKLFVLAANRGVLSRKEHAHLLTKYPSFNNSYEPELCGVVAENSYEPGNVSKENAPKPATINLEPRFSDVVLATSGDATYANASAIEEQERARAELEQQRLQEQQLQLQEAKNQAIVELKAGLENKLGSENEVVLQIGNNLQPKVVRDSGTGDIYFMWRVSNVDRIYKIHSDHDGGQLQLSSFRFDNPIDDFNEYTLDISEIKNYKLSQNTAEGINIIKSAIEKAAIVELFGFDEERFTAPAAAAALPVELERTAQTAAAQAEHEDGGHETNFYRLFGAIEEKLEHGIDSFEAGGLRPNKILQSAKKNTYFLLVYDEHGSSNIYKITKDKLFFHKNREACDSIKEIERLTVNSYTEINDQEKIGELADMVLEAELPLPRRIRRASSEDGDNHSAVSEEEEEMSVLAEGVNASTLFAHQDLRLMVTGAAASVNRVWEETGETAQDKLKQKITANDVKQILKATAGLTELKVGPFGGRKVENSFSLKMQPHSELKINKAEGAAATNIKRINAINSIVFGEDGSFTVELAYQGKGVFGGEKTKKFKKTFESEIVESSEAQNVLMAIQSQYQIQIEAKVAKENPLLQEEGEEEYFLRAEQQQRRASLTLSPRGSSQLASGKINIPIQVDSANFVQFVSAMHECGKKRLGGSEEDEYYSVTNNGDKFLIRKDYIRGGSEEKTAYLQTADKYFKINFTESSRPGSEGFLSCSFQEVQNDWTTPTEKIVETSQQQKIFSTLGLIAQAVNRKQEQQNSQQQESSL